MVSLKSGRAAALSFLGLGLLSACGDPSKFGQDIAEPRILGTRLASGDGVAELVPGQDAEIELLVAGPTGPIEVRVNYEVCQAVPTDRGVPQCTDVSYAAGTTDASSLPRVTVATPDDAEAGSPVGVLGVACRRGDPQLATDPVDWSCSDDGEPLNFSFDSTVSGEGRTNHNPDLVDTYVEVNGDAVLLTPVNESADCAEGVVRVAPGQSVPVEINLGEAVREAYDDEFQDQDTLETIQLSTFSTRGRFERQFTIVEPDAAPIALIDWSAPDVEGPVKAYFVLRDGFGGVSWSSFSLCVE